jgi:hypothetical protein
VGGRGLRPIVLAYLRKFLRYIIIILLGWKKRGVGWKKKEGESWDDCGECVDRDCCRGFGMLLLMGGLFVNECLY